MNRAVSARPAQRHKSALAWGHRLILEARIRRSGLAGTGWQVVARGAH